jgi:hypothetical protein
LFWNKNRDFHLLNGASCEKLKRGYENLSCCPGDGKNLPAKTGGTFLMFNGFTVRLSSRRSLVSGKQRGQTQAD